MRVRKWRVLQADQGPTTPRRDRGGYPPPPTALPGAHIGDPSRHLFTLLMQGIRPGPSGVSRVGVDQDGVMELRLILSCAQG